MRLFGRRAHRSTITKTASVSSPHNGPRCSICGKDAPPEVRSHFYEILTAGRLQLGDMPQTLDSDDGIWVMRRSAGGVIYACPETQHRHAVERRA